MAPPPHKTGPDGGCKEPHRWRGHSSAQVPRGLVQAMLTNKRTDPLWVLVGERSLQTGRDHHSETCCAPAYIEAVVSGPALGLSR